MIPLVVQRHATAPAALASHSASIDTVAPSVNTLAMVHMDEDVSKDNLCRKMMRTQQERRSKLQ